MLIKMFILVNMLVENLKAKESTRGTTEQLMLVNLKKAISTEKESGKNQRILILTAMKVNTSTTRKMVSEFLNGPQETLIKETTRMTKETVMEKCLGSTVLFTKESGRRVFSTGQEECNFQMARLRPACLKIMFI